MGLMHASYVFCIIALCVCGDSKTVSQNDDNPWSLTPKRETYSGTYNYSYYGYK